MRQWLPGRAAGSERQRGLGENQRHGAAGDDQRAQPFEALQTRRTMSGKGNDSSHACVNAPRSLAKGLNGAIPQVRAGICWLEQWNEPPPASTASARMPTVSRSGNSSAMAATPSASCAVPYVGTTTSFEVIAKFM